LKKHQDIFKGVDLLTLSACNTAAALPDSTGKEIDGFAESAQRAGAGAVIATLWRVSDTSTPWLMRDFYLKWNGQKPVTKSTALRSAQLALLNGSADTGVFVHFNNDNAQKNDGDQLLKVIVTPDKAHVSREINRGEAVYLLPEDAPPFDFDEKKPFAHPYFWATFILYGNWK
jgi:CHAT domain-containing protein